MTTYKEKKLAAEEVVAEFKPWLQRVVMEYLDHAQATGECGEYKHYLCSVVKHFPVPPKFYDIAERYNRREIGDPRVLDVSVGRTIVAVSHGDPEEWAPKVAEVCPPAVAVSAIPEGVDVLTRRVGAPSHLPWDCPDYVMWRVGTAEDGLEVGRGKSGCIQYFGGFTKEAIAEVRQNWEAAMVGGKWVTTYRRLW